MIRPFPFSKPKLIKLYLPFSLHHQHQYSLSTQQQQDNISTQQQQDNISTQQQQEMVITRRGFMAEQYIPRQKLGFDKEDKMCIYYYKPRIGDYLKQYSIILVPMAISQYFISTNYFAYTVPAMFPLLTVLQIVFIQRLFKMKQRHRRVLSEINLLKDGEMVEVVFSQQLWRKLKGDPVNQFQYIPKLYTPQQEEHPEQMRGYLFPETVPITAEQRLEMKSNFWVTKYYMTPLYYFLLRSNTQVFNTELLGRIFQGQVIKVDHENTDQQIQDRLQWAIQNNAEDQDLK